MRKEEEECKEGDRRANISLRMFVDDSTSTREQLGISKPQTITVKPGRHSPLLPLSLLLTYNPIFILFRFCTGTNRNPPRGAILSTDERNVLFGLMHARVVPLSLASLPSLAIVHPLVLSFVRILPLLFLC